MTIVKERTDDLAAIRAMFADEDGITADQAAVTYSDQRLEMAKIADPVLYAKWLERTYQWQCKLL